MTNLRAGRSRVQIPEAERDFFSETSIPALVATYSPIQSVLGLFPGDKEGEA
jgi:hypothetical protein